MAKWKLEKAALQVSERLAELSDQKLPMEILRVEEGLASVVFDIGGVDYIASLMVVPKQRPRPTSN